MDRIDHERAASSDGNRTLPAVPVARLTLAVLLVTALVTTAGFVRTNEIRPVDATPAPLSGTPDELYATAHENTAHSSRELTSTTVSDERTYDEEVRIDRERRQLVIRTDVPAGTYLQYFSHGTHHGFSTRAFPGYAMVDASEVFPGEPSPDATGWTVVAEKDDRLTLELTDPDSVFVVLFHKEPDEPLGGTVHESRAEVTIDTEREVLERGEVVLNVSDSADDRDYRRHSQFEYGVDPTVDRPAELDSPGIAERLWSVLAY